MQVKGLTLQMDNNNHQPIKLDDYSMSPLPFGEVIGTKTADQRVRIAESLRMFYKTDGAKFIQELFMVAGYNVLQQLRPMEITTENMGSANRLNGQLDVISVGQKDAVFGLIPLIEALIRYDVEEANAPSPQTTGV